MVRTYGGGDTSETSTNGRGHCPTHAFSCSIELNRVVPLKHQSTCVPLFRGDFFFFFTHLTDHRSPLYDLDIYKGASRRAALAARRFARRLHAMSSAVVVFAI